MQAFEIVELGARQAESTGPYLEFLREPNMSAGLYVLSAGSTDPQRPHTEPELYYVVAGRGRIQVGEEDRAVEQGSVVFVDRHQHHAFYDISEDLAVLVVFAPAETATGETI